MTSAEFIIGHSADDAGERKQEMRKVFWALLIAVAIHLLIGYSLAVYGGFLYAPISVTEEDKPVELSFVDLSTPAPTKNTMFVPKTSRNKPRRQRKKRSSPTPTQSRRARVLRLQIFRCRHRRARIVPTLIWIRTRIPCLTKAPNRNRAWRRSNQQRRNQP